MGKETQKASQADATVKVIFVFLFCILSFSIGTFVGKKFSDNQYRLSAMEPTEVKPTRATASIPSNVREVKPDNALTDDEIAKLADEFVSDEIEENSGAEANAPSEEILAEGTPGEVAEVAEQIAKNEVPDMGSVEKKKSPTERTPTSLPSLAAQSSIGKYTVQVASYSDEAEAKEFASDLKAKGYSAFYIPAKVRGQTWYRVSVGLFATQVEATSYRQKLLDQANLSSAIIQKIVK